MKSAIRLTFLMLAMASLFGGCSSGDMGESPEENPSILISSVMPDDDGVIRTVEESDSLLAEDEYYTSGQLDEPDYVFLDNGTVKTFALVWLPPSWNDLLPNQRRAIVHFHGHCALAAMHFSKWQVLAEPRNIAVIAPQVWLDDNTPPAGYDVHPDGGFHLDTDNDIFPFTDALLEYYEASSAMVHGFSMFACTSIILTYRDKYLHNRIDFTLFDAGHIGEDHPFREEIKQAASGGDSSQFSGENFYFFIETDRFTYPQQLDTRDFVIEFGGDTVGTFESEGPHGVFFTSAYDSLRESLVAYYDSTSGNN